MNVAETLLLAQVRQAGLPEPILDKGFLEGRRWRLDFQWTDRGPDYNRNGCGEDCECRRPNVAVEIDGGVWPSRQKDGTLAVGRHVRGKGYENDCRKLNAASAAGWIVLRFTPGMVDSGEALALLREVLADAAPAWKEEP